MGISQFFSSIDSVNKFNERMKATETRINNVNKATGDTSSAMDRAKASVDAAGKQVGLATAAFKQLSTIWGAVLAEAKKNSDEFKSKTKTLNRKLGKFVDLVMKGVIPVLIALVNVLTFVVTELNKYPGLLEAVGVGFAILLTTVTALAASQAAVASAMAVSAMALQTYAAAAWTAEKATNGLSWSKQKLSGAIKWVKNTTVAETAAKKASAAWDWAATKATNVYSAAKTALGTAVTAVTSVINRENATKAVGIVRDYASAAASYASAAASWTLASAKNAVAVVTGTLVSLISAQAAASYASAAASYAVSGAMWAFSAASSAASTAVGILTTVWTTFLAMSGVGLILVLVGAIVALVGALEMTGAVDVSGIFGGLLDSVMALIPSVSEITALLGSLAGVGGKPQGMMEWAQTLLSVLFPVIPVVRAILKQFGLLDDVGAMLQSAVGSVMGVVDSLLGGIKRLVSNPKETLTAFANAGIGFVKAMAKKLVTAGPRVLKNAISTALSAVVPFLPSSDAQRGPLSNLTGAGASLVKTIASGILGAPAAIGGAILSALGGALGGLGKAALSLGSEIANGIADGISGAAGAIGGAVQGAMDAAKGAADAVGGAVSGAASVASGAVGGAASMASDVGNAVGAAGQAAGNVAGGIGNAAGDLAGSIMGGGGGGKSQQNNTQIHFHGEVHDAQKIDKKVRDAQRQAVKQAQGGIEDVLDMGSDAAGSLL